MSPGASNAKFSRKGLDKEKQQRGEPRAKKMRQPESQTQSI
jgi:hypothetical protein